MRLVLSIASAFCFGLSVLSSVHWLFSPFATVILAALAFQIVIFVFVRVGCCVLFVLMFVGSGGNAVRRHNRCKRVNSVSYESIHPYH